MAYEMLIGLNVIDQANYTAYRQGMTPILEKYGGEFRYDFMVEKTLKSAISHTINRVFVISFPDAARKDNFFSDPDYKKVKQQYFEVSVQDTAVIATYSV